MTDKYDDKNKRGKKNKEDGYSNNRGVDMLSNLFGGMLGKAAKKIKERNKKNLPKGY